MNKQKKYHFFQRIGRAFKLNFIKLLRSPGGAKKVSLGFALGFGLEMLVISTASLVYIIFIPVVRMVKGSLPAAIIGNVIGKLTFLPVILLPIAKAIGKAIYPMNVKFGHSSSFSFQKLLHGDIGSLTSLLHGSIHVLIGMTIIGMVLGFISYFIVHYFYEKEKSKRIKKNREKHAMRGNTANKNFV
ncbi:DUF2062 domain-containing protein [Bacillota bacterium Lsc_1132]